MNDNPLVLICKCPEKHFPAEQLHTFISFTSGEILIAVGQLVRPIQLEWIKVEMQSGNDKKFCIVIFKSYLSLCTFFSSCSFLHPFSLFLSLPFYFTLPLFLSLPPSLSLSLFFSLSFSLSLFFSHSIFVSLFCNFSYL